jgi:hypothetical protein
MHKQGEQFMSTASVTSDTLSTDAVDKKTYLIRQLLCRSLVKTRNTLEVAAAKRRHVKQARKYHHIDLA